MSDELPADKPEIKREINEARSAGIRLAIGISGSGKTHSVKSEVYEAVRAGMPIIAIDRMREWNSVPRDIVNDSAGASDVPSAVKLINKGARLVVVRSPDSVGAAIAAIQWARDYACEKCGAREQCGHDERVAGVAIPEAHRVMPNGRPLDPAIEDAACAWRHHKIALWLDTQRISLLSRTVTEQARQTRVFAVIGDRDRTVIRELGAPELEEYVLEAAARLGAGKAGWHVRLGLTRLPPYELEKM